MQKLTRRFLATGTVAALLTAPAVARAEAPIALPVDVSKMIESSYEWLQSQTSKPAPARSPAFRAVPAADKTAAEPTAPLINPPIRLALVARDWGKAYGVFGRKTISDDVRLSRSSRMLIGRARLELGRVQPFVQAALGEWRYDPTLLTILPHNREYATQVAMGVELRLAGNTRLALEADYTLLVREVREPQNNPDPHVLSAFGVVQTKF